MGGERLPAEAPDVSYGARQNAWSESRKVFTSNVFGLDDLIDLMTCDGFI